MKPLWTPEQVEWLRENYPHGTIAENAVAFEEKFGIARSRQCIYQKANKLGLHKLKHVHERNAPAVKRMRWSDPRFEREREWMLENDVGGVYDTIDAFEREFGIRLNRSQVSLFRSTYGTQKRVSRGGGKPAAPIGTERAWKDGYIKVKVAMYPKVPQSKDNWRFKHWIAWEEANGRSVPKGWTVLFADRDRRNFDPDNLVCIPRKYVGQLNNPDLPDYHDRESLEACIRMCDLRTAIIDADYSMPRRCEVCGEMFVPPESKRWYRTPPQTCNDCLSQGRRARGERNSGQGKCVVCGETYIKSRRNQKRCPSCIAEHPKW